MDIQPEAAGFDRDRLARITDHLDRNYIASGKLVGCQALVARHGHPAYFQSLGEHGLTPRVNCRIYPTKNFELK